MPEIEGNERGEHKSCPFCGGQCGLWTLEGGEFWVQCRACSGHGPAMKSKQIAWLWWDKRWAEGYEDRERDRLRQLSRLRRDIEMLEAAAFRRNRELDALHMVWCDGPCTRGVHRYAEEPTTSGIELEKLADIGQRNVDRLRKKAHGIEWQKEHGFYRGPGYTPTEEQLERGRQWWAEHMSQFSWNSEED